VNCSATPPPGKAPRRRRPFRASRAKRRKKAAHFLLRIPSRICLCITPRISPKILPPRRAPKLPHPLSEKISKCPPGWRRRCGRNSSSAARAVTWLWWNKNSAELAGLRCRCERVCRMQCRGTGQANMFRRRRSRGWNSRLNRIASGKRNLQKTRQSAKRNLPIGKAVRKTIRKSTCSRPRWIRSCDERQLIWAQGVKPITDDVPRLFLEQQLARQRRSRWLMGAALALLVGILFYVGAHGTVAWLRAHDVAQNAAVKGDSAAGRASSSLSGGSGGASSGGSSSAGSALPAQTAKRDDVTPAVVVHALSPKPAGYSATRRDDERNPAGAGASTQTSYAPASAADRHALSDRSLGDHALGDHALGDHSLADHVLADLGGHGAEELAIAESFLSGTQGKARDSSEAAQWLWKAVGKENAAAALLLSDLYVTGDGVPRNCDQARLLLDAAASRGVPGAGERIRDLPNLGCE
jgi:hypothetical protein